MDKIDEFIKRLNELENEYGVYLRLDITKEYKNGIVTPREVDLNVINPKSVYIKSILNEQIN